MRPKWGLMVATCGPPGPMEPGGVQVEPSKAQMCPKGSQMVLKRSPSAQVGHKIAPKSIPKRSRLIDAFNSTIDQSRVPFRDDLNTILDPTCAQFGAQILSNTDIKTTNKQPGITKRTNLRDEGNKSPTGDRAGRHSAARPPHGHRSDAISLRLEPLVESN